MKWKDWPFLGRYDPPPSIRADASGVSYHRVPRCPRCRRRRWTHVTTTNHRHWWADRETLFAGTPCHCGRCRVRWTQPHSYSVVFSVRGMDKSALAEWVLGK